MTPNDLKYIPIEQLCQALIFAIQKLKHYFQAHTVNLISKANLMKYNFKVKGQLLADFLADHPLPAEWELCDELPDEDVMNVKVMPLDGAVHQEGAGARVALTIPQQDHLPYSFSISHKCSNNVAEYQAHILGLKVCIKIITITKPGHAKACSKKTKQTTDALAGLATSLAFSGKEIRVPICENWVVPPLFIPHEYEEGETETTMAIVTGTGSHDDWRQPIIDYLQQGKLPDDVRKKIDIRRRAPRFIYFNDTLFRRSFEEVLLRCLSNTSYIQADQEGQKVGPINGHYLNRYYS
ncbi:hypothetical protein LIER_03241 [Lithospermum erythrorhizon]|uniref:Uncharacterized protein n=1 Tax=Lithospermum erythrorhizon TaxID=34254 RepID=A0AAV3NWB6_LITER